MLLKTVEDIVDNYAATATDVTNGVYRAFVENGKWKGWNTFYRLSEKNRLHLIRANIYLQDSSAAVRSGMMPHFGILVRQGLGIVNVSPKAPSLVQGNANYLDYGPLDTEWGVASGWPGACLTAGDILTTSLVYQRYLP